MPNKKSLARVLCPIQYGQYARRIQTNYLVCTEYKSMSYDVRSVTSSPHMNHTEKQDVSCHTERWSHVMQRLLTCLLPPPLNVLFLKLALAQFWTPIDVLQENNSPNRVVIPKVVTFGVFKINVPFLHSV